MFAVGLSRTGTSSMTSALQQLGIPTIHYPHDEVTQHELQHEAPLSVLEAHRAITDISVAPFHGYLADLYPRSRFLLTVRAPSTWVRSMQAHLTYLDREWERFPRQFRRFTSWIVERVYGGLRVEDAALLRRYTEHVTAVRDHFADAPSRLLEIDVADDEAWPRLATFLGAEAPSGPFPHRNQGRPRPR